MKWPNQFKPWSVSTVVDSIVVVGALTCCALFHSVCDLKASQMNMQSSLIRGFMLYKFKHPHDFNRQEFLKLYPGYYHTTDQA